ncbi:MAG: hypothetical protein VX938_07190, partial [Myxococcota bacterium]|nr:hypothetical protein [Myxococcota bacterium]
VAWLMHLSGVPQESPPTPETLGRAREIYEEAECGECHNPPGGSYLDEDWELDAAGPELTGYQSYEWIRGLLRDATHLDYFGGILEAADHERSMPPNPDLSSDELDLLVRWLMHGAPGAD